MSEHSIAHPIIDYFDWGAEKLSLVLRHRMKFASKYKFINRSAGNKDLLLILAGFQPFYWDTLLERVKLVCDSSSNPIDVCICVPGVDGDGTLQRLAESYNWSYLRIKHDLLAKVQNTAILLHPNAENIFKIDEDIVLPFGYFDNMKKAYNIAKEKFYTSVGFICPCININAYSVQPFLKAIDLWDEFSSRFGKYNLGNDYIKADIHRNPEMALWIWEKTLPFDKIAEIVYNKNHGQLSLVPHRFSIGAIMIKKEIWEKMGGFFVSRAGKLGVEEYELCNYCSTNMLGIINVEDILVGHLGFGPQKTPVKDFFISREQDFKMKK